ERLAAWKQKVGRAEPEPEQEQEHEPHDWRDAIAGWTKRQLAGTRGEAPLLAAGPLHDVARRLGFADDEAPMLWLVYGARLCGLDGIAPVDLADVCPRRWDDALGKSRLAALGVFAWRRNRVH